MSDEGLTDASGNKIKPGLYITNYDQPYLVKSDGNGGFIKQSHYPIPNQKLTQDNSTILTPLDKKRLEALVKQWESEPKYRGRVIFVKSHWGKK